jgi:hypothetical protein
MSEPTGYECVNDPACRVLAWPIRDHSMRCAEQNRPDRDEPKRVSDTADIRVSHWRGRHVESSIKRTAADAEFDRWLAAHDAEKDARIAALSAVIERVRKVADDDWGHVGSWVAHHDLIRKVTAAADIREGGKG